jgi:hypothetical protein
MSCLMATIRFLPDWTEEQIGVIQAGEQLTIEYDPARLPGCRSQRYGRRAWSIQAVLRFQPESQEQSRDLAVGPFQVDVPAGTTHIEMWFRNTDSNSCQAWDSRFGENYWWDVAAAS